MASSLGPDTTPNTKLRLVTMRDQLVGNIRLNSSNTKLPKLLVEVEGALDRFASGGYGFCEACGTQIDGQTLQVDPLIRRCLSHLPADRRLKVLQARRDADLFGLSRTKEDYVTLPRRPQEESIPTAMPKDFGSWRVFQALKSGWRILLGQADQLHEQDQDINRASLIQSDLLPASHLRLEPWEVYFVYASAGPLGGDYCDLAPGKNGDLFLFFGDAMGKGIAAAMIVSRLHVLFRTLLALGLPIAEMFDRANRIFCECARDGGYYATIVCCHASATGALQLINAGHLPPLLLRREGTERILATGMPLGLFYTNTCEVTHIQLTPGETLLFYTDGITEARNASEAEYGSERLERLASERKHLGPKELVHTCHADVSAYAATTKLSDDLTLLALHRL